MGVLTQRGKLAVGILVAIFLLMLAVGLAYPAPITKDDALAWIERVGPETVAETLVRINNGVPTVTMPGTIYLLDGRDLVIAHEPKAIDVSMPPYIHYTIQLPDERVKDFAPPGPSVWRVLGAIAVGSAMTVLADETLGLRPVARQAAAVGVGIASGLAAWFAWR